MSGNFDNGILSVFIDLRYRIFYEEYLMVIMQTIPVKEPALLLLIAHNKKPTFTKCVLQIILQS